IDLKYLVIHKATKEAGSDLVGLKKAEKLLKINDNEKFFISDVRKSFYGRSLPTYGIFEEGNPGNLFHKALNEYLADRDFYNFSVKSMDYYKRILSASAPATGGFLIFAEYRYLP